MSLSAHLQALARMPTTLVPEREVLAIAKAYDATPTNPEYRFRHYFHNVIPDAARRARPPAVDELTWRGLLDEVGGEHNAEGLWPVPGDGFKTLAERARVQDAELASQREYLDAVDARVREMRRFRGARLAERVAQVARTQAEQQHRLLRLMRTVERLEASHHASRGGGWGDEGMDEGERALAARLRRLQGALNRSATSLPRRVDALAAAHRAEKAADAAAASGAAVAAKRAKGDVIGRAFAEDDDAAAKAAAERRAGGTGRSSAAASAVDPTTAAAYNRIIAEQAEATRHLAEVLREDLRDLAVLRRERAAAAAAAAEGRY